MKTGQILRQIPRKIKWSVLIWSSVVFACQSLPVATSDKDHPETHSLHQTEMATEMDTDQANDSDPGQKTVPDEKTLRQFSDDYFSADTQKRAIFDKYLGELGADAMLDFLESTYPQCHGESHELGQSIFAKYKKIGAALGQCKARCTTGCMHGVLVEAFREYTFEDITGQLAGFCKDDMTAMYKPGNCAHGTGHALIMVTNYNIAEAIKGCSTFLDPAMQYYCASGVFMEYLQERKHSTTDPQQPESLHFPCDTYTQFPAACYRYKTLEILEAFEGDTEEAFEDDMEEVAEECLALPRERRLGCFHGLGWAYIEDIGDDPALLSEVCRYGTSDDQTVCIEGAIEKLSDFNKETALSACSALKGENASVCRAAAEEKMYRMNKPTMGLYTGRGVHSQTGRSEAVGDSPPLR